MGYREISVRVPADYTVKDLKKKISNQIRTKDFSFKIRKKSLDARRKSNICWNISVGVTSSGIKGGEAPSDYPVEIPFINPGKKVVITGFGPAGFFAARVLALAGFEVEIAEMGKRVDERAADISRFESTGEFIKNSNYLFGEGGAGTFSDGKLTSRTKAISLEKQFIFRTFSDAGAPEEINYLAHPHLGSDNLRKMAVNMRNNLLSLGATINFNTSINSIVDSGTTIEAIRSEDNREFRGDYFIFATGHSNYKLFRMLINSGIPFQSKPFAIGTRAEHPTELINCAQWGVKELTGVKAAEYRLTCSSDIDNPVYTFCMCPGGKIVPSAPFEGLNVVNGMSNYLRNSPWSNAAVVAAVKPEELAGSSDPLVILDWLENLERSFYNATGSYKAPATPIKSLIENRTISMPDSSYPMGIEEMDFNNLFPASVTESIKTGLKYFSQKLSGYDEGLLVGLESKTSSPIQAVRDKCGRTPAFSNLYISGEAGGFAGGIVSSAADGIKTALNIIERESGY